ncbi:MAG: alpha/beta hydrolase [Plectolyngbya sp. WJT66-NPBG17]|nr:alpha/beta hydrolase [Plectolyngbya sp. WJT66-NPBG17]MBW4525132.1 alpha/beta hydrolase [Phormidium tanganyikae FI6-MK23]
MSRHLLTIEPFDTDGFRFPGYMVSSTAPINVEDKTEDIVDRDPNEVLKEIVDYLQQPEGDAEILIAVHGYNSDKSGARWWYEETRKHISQNYADHVSPRFMVIGYRWPSEKVVPDSPGGLAKKLLNGLQFLKGTFKAFKALPKPLAIAGMFGLSLWVIGGIFNTAIAFLKLVSDFTILVASSFVLTISLFVVVIILTIFILRISGYFRDTYRAANYGVADLVEFIRQLDSQLVQQAPNQPRIRLNFIGHSMGAYVVTNTVRILSDVFDRDSIGNLDVSNQGKSPSSNIGNVFRLSRLVLVAPDISAETIISGRGNPLRSSLRRFDEAYLFSNEGDMVLKIASTVANYFSFPASTRDGGYRLGNVIVGSPGKFGLEKNGIVNVDDRGKLLPLKGTEFLNCLYLRQGVPLSKRQEEIGLEDDRFIAELFTYFDCTNYRENGKGMVSQALGKSFLDYKDYVALVLSGVDGHGGLLYQRDADFSRRLIYGLSCLGFEKMLTTLDPNQSDQQVLLKIFSQRCEAKGIQVLLANERYDRDVLFQPELSDRQGY